MCSKCTDTQFTQVFILTDLLSYSVFILSLSFLRRNHSFESKKHRVVFLFYKEPTDDTLFFAMFDYCILIKRRKSNS